MSNDLYVNQGTDWFESVDYLNDDGTPVNLAGYTFISAFRISYSTRSLSGNITVQILNPAAGNTLLSMNAAETTAVATGKYVYDVVMIDPFSNQTRVLEGYLTIRPGVTIR